jgi:hypothetical protein
MHCSCLVWSLSCVRRKSTVQQGMQVANEPPELGVFRDDLAALSGALQDTTKRIDAVDAQARNGAAALQVHSAALERLQATAAQSDESITALMARVAGAAARVNVQIAGAVAPLARGHELDALRKRIVAMRGELAAGMESSKEEVKFDLLKEGSPQVQDLRTFLARQVSFGMSFRMVAANTS